MSHIYRLTTKKDALLTNVELRLTDGCKNKNKLAIRLESEKDINNEWQLNAAFELKGIDLDYIPLNIQISPLDNLRTHIKKVTDHFSFRLTVNELRAVMKVINEARDEARDKH